MNWTKDNLAGMPYKNGFYLRGDNMSRVETFVAAAFAFLLTMVMVAGNDIPVNVDDFRAAVFNIPAFVICAVQIIWIWYEHAVWSRRFGLEDAWTVCLSGFLIVIVLVYVYPLKAMAAGFLSWISNNYFSSDLQPNSIDDVKFLFYFFSGGFLMLSLCFWAMHQMVLSRAKILCLNQWEAYQTKTEALGWLIMMMTSLISITLTKFLQGNAVAYAGIIYASLGISMTMLHILRARRSPAESIDERV